MYLTPLTKKQIREFIVLQFIKLRVLFVKNNWMRQVVRVKRVDKGRTEELREEVGGKEGFRRKLVRRQERMEGERLTKRTDMLRGAEDRRKRGGSGQ